MSNNINFNVDLLPTTDSSFKLGDSTHRWIIHQAPLKSKEYTYTISSNDTNNGRIIFATIAFDDSNFYTPWQVHYRLTVQGTSTSALRGYYDVKIGAAGSVTSFYIENNFYTSYYPINSHTLYKPKDYTYSSEGAMIGVRMQSASLATEQRIYKIEILEEKGCSVTFLDSIGTYGNLYDSTKWTYEEYNATVVGLQESGDADTFTSDELRNVRITVDSEMPLCHGCLFGYTPSNLAVPFSAYTSSYTAYTMNTSTARVYPSHGIDWLRGMYVIYNWCCRAANTTNTDPVRTFYSGLDFRYTDNCVASSASTTLGMLPEKPVYIRGVIKDDGLFYIRPISVTYNSKTYQRAWTQDKPTRIECDSDGYQYTYWYVGKPYYNSTYANGNYQINFESIHPMFWYSNEIFQEYLPEHIHSEYLTSWSTLNATKLSGTIPSNCYTNTTYSVATTSANGLMSSTDKKKLNNIAASVSGETLTLTLS